MMLDDIRNHDANPTPEEEDWTQTDPVRLVVKAIALAAVAIAIGASMSQLLVTPEQAQVILGRAR
jgi:hypothetical protein